MSPPEEQHGAEGARRLVVVSNRLPIAMKRIHGRWEAEPGSGGLVTALAPVLRNRGGMWIGWPGTGEQAGLAVAAAHTSHDVGYALLPVMLTPADVRDYYRGFSNEIIWPLFHDLQSHCNFDPAYWDAYKTVNHKFAEAITTNTGPDDFIWVHDYHLMLVARELRRMGISSRLGFFLHIPFPPLDLFVKLPWRSEILRGLLEYDLIGFQTARDRRNFIQCARTLIKTIEVEGRGQVVALKLDGREIRVGNFPISIDYHEFEEWAASNEVADRAWLIHEDLPERQIILGIDRLDYTKGIPYRLQAFRHLLLHHPEHRRRVSLVQVVVPSRRGIPKYRDLKTEIEQLIGEINGQLSESGWVPIHYAFRRLDHAELLAYYRTAEIALITPLKDGMNLVAKEYCACSLEEDGVVILSEFAGAAPQFQRGALLVNPYDIVGVADVLHQALTMDTRERRRRMRRLRHSTRRQDIFWWVDSFLAAAIAKTLRSFPLLEDYVPQMQPTETGNRDAS